MTQSHAANTPAVDLSPRAKLEIYGATSWIFGDKSAGFWNSHEWLAGGNWYFTKKKLEKKLEAAS